MKFRLVFAIALATSSFAPSVARADSDPPPLMDIHPPAMCARRACPGSWPQCAVPCAPISAPWLLLEH